MATNKEVFTSLLAAAMGFAEKTLKDSPKLHRDLLSDKLLSAVESYGAHAESAKDSDVLANISFIPSMVGRLIETLAGLKAINARYDEITEKEWPTSGFSHPGAGTAQAALAYWQEILAKYTADQAFPVAMTTSHSLGHNVFVVYVPEDVYAMFTVFDRDLFEQHDIPLRVAAPTTNDVHEIHELPEEAQETIRRHHAAKGETLQ